MSIRKSDLALGFLGLAALSLLAVIAHALISGDARHPAAAARLVAELGLTDLALFTEARYTRHPSQADLNTPFQDHPMSFDHFPTGSLIAPPARFGPTGGFAKTPGEGAR
ncbi:MAG: hypothetical protein C0605_04650 [Hyphomicrobiales bacterium]|nr:MAG: hypothetical protein C0605_04650 [Hyphomicrobiales bacterium]